MHALVIVDAQVDFCPGGALAVPDGDAIMSVINREIRKFDLVVATQDWHPANHEAFAENHPDKKLFDTILLNGASQILWPRHCVENTPGAYFHPALRVGRIARIFPKGTNPIVHNFSGFFNDPDPYTRQNIMPMAGYLKEQKVKEITVVGLALDYCVKYTALDALALGFEVAIIVNATRAVDVKKGDGDAALAEMLAAGVELK